MEIIPIPTLSPSSTASFASTTAFRAQVTLLWPYSSATGQCALLLADPDARKRYQNGQVRVRFSGPSARAIAASGIGIGHVVQLCLQGARWLTESETPLVKTPGKSVDGELVFEHRLRMTVESVWDEGKEIDVDQSAQVVASSKQNMLPPSTPVAKTKSSTSFDAYGVAVYSSPAFMKRLRLSEGGTPYSSAPLSENDDLDTVASRKRRRVSYKNVSEWKFDAREPSPEKEGHVEIVDVDADEDSTAETPVQTSNFVEAGNIAGSGIDSDQHMQDTDPLENVDPETEAQKVQEPVQESAETPVHKLAGETIVAEPVDQIPPEPQVQSTPEVHASNNKREKASLEAKDLAETTRRNDITAEEDSQELGSSSASQVEAPSAENIFLSDLPRLNILPTESELLQQMGLAQNTNGPLTPRLQPLVTEGLSLPSPFPTSAQKIPSPVFSNVVIASETNGEDTNEAQESRSNEEDVGRSGRVETAQPLIAQTTVSTVSPSQPEPPRPDTVADTYDGYAQEVPVVLSSDSESERDDERKAKLSEEVSAAGSSPIAENVTFGSHSRGDRFDDESSVEDESDEEMESCSESDSDIASSVYNSDQIAELQEESDQEEALEEPDWDYLERKLEQEETAIQQSREDLTARAPELIETADDMVELDDAVMHDDNSELDEDVLPRSDDESDDDDSDDSHYFDRAVMPEQEESYSEDSEADGNDQSYQPSMPEHAMYSHPFGLDGAHTMTETRTALPSQTVSENASVAGDETIAWRDMDVAVQALGRAQSQHIGQAEQPRQPQNAPPPSSSRLDVVELLDSDSEDEDEESIAPMQQDEILPTPQPVRETKDFSSSIELVNQLLDNKQKDAHLVLTGPVTSQIRSEIRQIADRATNQSTASTKFNALKTICEIGVNIAELAETGHIFAEGVKYRLKEDEVLVNACWKIYNELSSEEKYRDGQPPDLIGCLEMLEVKRDYCFEGFTDFLKEFKQNHLHKPKASPAQLDQSIQENGSEPKVVPQTVQENQAARVEETEEQQSIAGPPAVGVLKPNVVEGPSEDAAEPIKDSNDEEGPSATEVQAVDLAPVDPTEVKSPSVDGPSPPRSESLAGQEDSQSADDHEDMDIEAEHPQSPQENAYEHEIDPALLAEEHEFDPRLLEEGDSIDPDSSAEKYEADPALTTEHEIDPALLAEDHDESPSNDHLGPMPVDDAMSDAPEPDAFLLVDEVEVNQPTELEEDVALPDALMMDESPPSQARESQMVQPDEAAVKPEVQPSVETDIELLQKARVEDTQAEASPTSPASTPGSKAQYVKDEIRPVSSSSFRTLSPSPAVVEVQAAQSILLQEARDEPHFVSQTLDHPIEELDLSQVEPSWTSRFSQFSQSRSSRAHTRSETIPDSAEEDATDLVAEGSDTSSSPASPQPQTQTSPQSTQKVSAVQASQELGTTISQFANQPYGQSQLDAIEERSPPDEEVAAEDAQSQAGLDDELLADYVHVDARAARAEVAVAPSTPQAPPSTPASTKKPARPLTLFRGRRSAGSRLSVGDTEQQAARDEVMQDAPVNDKEVSGVKDEKEGTTEGNNQVQDEAEPSLIHAPAESVDEQQQSASNHEKAPENVSETTPQEAEVPVKAKEAQITTEVERANSNFQIKPTLKPFAEVEASLFGTPPAKNKPSAPQEPQSAPSQTWRHAFSSRMAEVPVIGSWFTPHRTTVMQKAATEHKPITSKPSLFEETPTKAAIASKEGSRRGRDRTISPPPLQRLASQGTSTSLSYFTPLPALHQHLNQTSSLIDTIAVCTSASCPADRAKSGPKDYYTTFRIMDQPLYEHYSSQQSGKTRDIRVEVFRPFKQSLPVVQVGDVVLLRGFVVRSREHKRFLLSTAASGWCVWRYGGDESEGLVYEDDGRPVWSKKEDKSVREEVTGPPVEIGDEERDKVRLVREWWQGLEKGKNNGDEAGHDLVMID